MCMAMGGALKCIVKRVLCDHVLREFTLYKQNFLICPKFEGKVAFKLEALYSNQEIALGTRDL